MFYRGERYTPLEYFAYVSLLEYNVGCKWVAVPNLDVLTEAHGQTGVTGSKVGSHRRTMGLQVVRAMKFKVVVSQAVLCGLGDEVGLLWIHIHNPTSYGMLV